MRRLHAILPLCALGLAAALPWSCATGDDPCDPNPCDDPPQNTCQGSVALLYPSTGACNSVADVVECTYTPAQTDCAQTGLYCHEGSCLADPCNPNPCTSPPAAICEADVAVTYEEVGTCEVADQLVDCSYAEAGRDNCALTNHACEAGECVLSTNPCAPNPCTSSPDDFCTGEVASIHPAVGTCTVNGTAADCAYDPIEVDCAESSLICQGGGCVAPPDPCVPNPCTSPPADTCTGDVANVHPSTGTCTDNAGSPSCAYAPATVNCAQSGLICQGGLCVTAGDPCNPNPCTNPPADTCSGDTATHYPGTGSCADAGGIAQCTYTPTTENCATAGEVCSGGQCMPPQTGGLIFSEYVEGPSGFGYEKYVEIYNAGSSSVNLDGYKLKLYANGATTATTTSVLPSRVLLPGQLVVISHSSASTYYTAPDRLTASAVNFNGDDAIQLTTPADAQVDIVGTIGSTTSFGADKALIRNSGISAGVASGAWNPSEWADVAPTANTLGTHTP